MAIRASRHAARVVAQLLTLQFVHTPPSILSADRAVLLVAGTVIGNRQFFSTFCTSEVPKELQLLVYASGIPCSRASRNKVVLFM